MPFALPGPIALLLCALGWFSVDGAAVVAAAALFGLLVLVCVVVPWARVDARWQAIPPLIGSAFPAVLAAGDRTGGMSPFVLLSLIPVIWVALYHERWQAWLSVALAGIAVGAGTGLAGNSAAVTAGTTILAVTICGLGAEMLQRLLRAEREAADGLRSVRDQQRKIFDHLPETAILVIDPTGRIVSAEGGTLGGAALSRDDLIGRRLEELVPPERLAPMRAAVDAALAGETLKIAHRGLYHEGDYELDLMPLRGTSDEIVAAMCVTRDVTVRKATEARLQHLASHDDLTGLWNRRRFSEAVREDLARVRRHGQDAALLLIDLDGFKGVNDRFGHAAGDRLLVVVADAIRGRLRASDHAGRLGGDEFAVLLHGVGADDADRVADEFRTAIEATKIHFGGVEVSASTSVGAAAVGPDTADEEALLARADAAMYAEKAARS
ncbi:MAG: hypothetical protein QOF76_2128 [Solirubrobacteraceae bacterium]|nr:hypothetical protein [Solirubrobacteraceae bacterium]